MTQFTQDVRLALRQLRKSPGFTLSAILMLAFAICANSTVFSWINGTMLHPIAGARDTGGVVSVMRGRWSDSPAPPFSYLDYRDLRAANQSFTGMLAYHHEWITMTGGDVPERIYACNVSGNYFDVLGINPRLGRFFVADEEARPGGAMYVVLSYSLWQTRYAGDPAIVGKVVEIARHPVTVIGVSPEGFTGAMPGIREDAWLPLDPLGNDGQLRDRSSTFLNVLGRLRPGVTRGQANADLERLMRQLVAAYPKDHIGVNTLGLDPMWRSPFGANIYLSRSLPILLAIAGVVLLLTCVNVATLALVRFITRRRELAIRESLGAGRLQLVRQMVLEGMLVSVIAAALALGLTARTAKHFGDFIPPNANAILLQGSMDGYVVLAVILLSMVATMICGAFPALRSSKVNVVDVLKEESGSVAGGGHRRLLSALVVSQVALSLALLVTSALFLRTLRNLNDSDPGFNQDHVISASVGLNIAGYSEEAATAISHRILDEVSTVPGVNVASLTDWLPFSYSHKTTDAWPEGYAPQPSDSLEVRRAEVSAGYFQSLGMKIVSGRDFTPDDKENAARVAIVDQTLAARYWPNQSPLGRRLMIWGHPVTIVGVVRNSKHQSVNEPIEPMVYMSYFQREEPELIVQVQVTGDPDSFASAITEAIHRVDRSLPVYDVRSLHDTTQMSSAFTALISTFATMFAVIALVLAATGIYGVVAYRTQLRTHEIGIRVALGASRRDVMRLVLMQGVRLTLGGILLGLGLAYGLTRVIARMLYGVSTTDPVTIAAVTVLLTLVAVLSCIAPATKAMRMDPIKAIRVL